MFKLKCGLAAIISVGLIACSGGEKASTTPAEVAAKPTKPNVVIFYVDDLGYGDLSSYGATAVQTPNVDALAAEGIRFLDGHSPAATCTPSRFSMFTGRLAIRQKAAIINGDAPLVIPHEKQTMMDMFKEAGYATAAIGKWHLGVGNGNVNWNEAVKPGPLEIGFDYSLIIPATGDRVPTAYLEGHHIKNLDLNDPITVSYGEKIGDRPVGRENPELLKFGADDQHSDSIVNGISRIGYMAGGKSAEWKDEDFPIVFTNRAKEWIGENKDQPFFLFFPFNDIHVPRAPNPMFVGKTTMGPRGDGIVQMDWMTGQIVAELKKQGVYDNTIIIFSSDNGPVLDDGYDDGAREMLGEHNPAGIFRGGKYSAYEAGTRVPLIISWPNGIKNGGESDALISHIDFFRSFANLLDIELPNDVAIDSADILEAMIDAKADGRNEMIEESFTLSLRDGDWKYIRPFAGTTPGWLANKFEIENGLSPKPQLFKLSEDLTESQNLAEQHPEIVDRMEQRLKEILTKTSL